MPRAELTESLPGLQLGPPEVVSLHLLSYLAGAGSGRDLPSPPAWWKFMDAGRGGDQSKRKAEERRKDVSPSCLRPVALLALPSLTSTLALGKEVGVEFQNLKTENVQREEVFK